MIRPFLITALAASTAVLSATAALSAQQTSTSRPKFDGFEVATVKPIEHNPQGGRYFRMESNNRFVVRDYTLKLLIAAAYDLNPRTISGGPDWIDSDHYNIDALTPGDIKPVRTEQMAMLRSLLTERFHLAFHREQKDFSIYELTVAPHGAKLKPSTMKADDPPALIATVYPPSKIVLPARNATVGELAAMMQRAMLDRPVVDKTGLTGRYDFDLEWAPDETQFGGEVPRASNDAPSPPLFIALQEQLGLKITATRGKVSALMVDKAEKPTDN